MTNSETPTDPEAVVRAYWRSVWLDRDLEALDALVADHVVRHTPEGTRRMSRADLKATLRESLAAVRSQDMSVDALTVDGDTVWIRLTLQSVSMATMAPMPLTYLAQYRIENGQIAELWQMHQSGLDWH